jgi:hypothetical protein
MKQTDPQLLLRVIEFCFSERKRDITYHLPYLTPSRLPYVLSLIQHKSSYALNRYTGEAAKLFSLYVIPDK